MSTGPVIQPGSTAERLRAELTFMYELCQVVASHSELQPILDWIVQKTTSMLSADEGSIKLLSPDFATPTLKTLIRTEGPGIQSGSWPTGIAMNVMGFLMAKGLPLATPDLLDDPQFPSLRSQQQTRIRAVLAVPLKVDNRFTGMLAVTQAVPGRQWTEDEKQLLAIVAQNSASVIEQARLKIEAEEKRRLEEQQRLLDRELETARGIQMSLLPSRALRSGPWEAMGRVVPARQVGGDAFDYYTLDDGRFAVAIADVSGKGVPASLLMSNVQASLRAFCDGRTPLPDAMRQINLGLMRGANGKFVTLFYGEVDHVHGVLRYSNAGHNYPLVRRADGSLVELTEGGLPLGLMNDATYEQGECPFGPSDALLLYSDGISEALDARGREYGEDRLRDVWAREGATTPGAVIETVYAEVEAFRGRAVQSDDMTLVVVGVPAAG